MNPGQKAGVFYWLKIAKGRKTNGSRQVAEDKWPKTSGRRQAVVKRGEKTETRHSSYSSHKRITKPLQCGAQTDVQFCGLPNIEVTPHHYCENVRIAQVLHFILPL